MSDWHSFGWADEATEATVAVVDDAAIDDPAELLRRLGPTDEVGTMAFDAALDLQGSYYDDGTFDGRAVFQVDRVGGEGGWWGVVEPNGFRASFETRLIALAQDRPAASFFWNVNAVMSLLRVENGGVVNHFDPLLDIEQGKRHAGDLPFEDHPAGCGVRAC